MQIQILHNDSISPEDLRREHKMYKAKIYIMAEPANTRKSKKRYGKLFGLTKSAPMVYHNNH